MRQQKLSGYLLHQRPYQEKRAIYQFFTRSHGVVHGVGARGMPLFTPLTLLATGKNSLKSFSQISLGFAFDFQDELQLEGMAIHETVLTPIKGRAQYALLYMNELLYKLLPAENPSPVLWQAYHTYLTKLHLLDNEIAAGSLDVYQAMQTMKVFLRAFEVTLFSELGVLPDFMQDNTGEAVMMDMMYRFIPEMGFIHDGQLSLMFETGKLDGHFRVPPQSYRGVDLLAMGQAVLGGMDGIANSLQPLSQLSRQLVDHLLDYQPLHSRKLWQQSLRYH